MPSFMKNNILILALFGAICSCSKTDGTTVTKEFVYTEAEFPSCHAATIVEYPQGQLNVAFFGGSHESADDVCIWLSRKEMKDTVWSSPQMVAQDSLAATWNPVLYSCKDGRMLLFYKTGKRVAWWKGHVKTSYDGGYTWDEDYAFPDGMIGAVKNKPVRLACGRIISPSSEEIERPNNPSIIDWTVHFELSDDDGHTWRKVGPVAADDSVGVIQPTILVHKDGSVEALLRSRNGKIGSTVSKDNGQTWSAVELIDFPNNNSGIDAVTLPDGRFVMVCNPVGKGGKRYPLAVFVSDDARHWEELCILEDEPCPHGYCYPSIILGSDGALHCIYTWNRQRIRYARIDYSNSFHKRVN